MYWNKLDQSFDLMNDYCSEFSNAHDYSCEKCPLKFDDDSHSAPCVLHLFRNMLVNANNHVNNDNMKAAE